LYTHSIFNPHQNNNKTNKKWDDWRPLAPRGSLDSPVVNPGLDGHGQKQHSGRLWLLNYDPLVVSGPKYAKKISPPPLHHHHQPEPLIQGRMDPCSCLLTLPPECHSRNGLLHNLVVRSVYWSYCCLSII